MKIFVAGIQDAGARALLRQLTIDDDLWFAAAPEFGRPDRDAFLEAEVVLGGFPLEMLGSASRLRWIQLLAVGIDAYRSANWPAVGGQVICTNLRGVFAEPMAQSVLAGVLAFNRGIVAMVRLQDKGDWQKDYLHSQMRVLRHAHVLLLGGGSVGTRLREIFTLFGCTCSVYARTSGDVRTLAELDAALPKADIVCAALPETPATRGLLDARRIALMKPDALFANVGRGSLLDEQALVRALESNRLRGAVIDVTQREPLSPDHPLWKCPRILLSQHSAAGSHDELSAAINFFGENLTRYRAGVPLVNAINWNKGY
jgi:phosphoglycerate dehydrogenase-like enzyme